ncbi:response regulator [Aerophototrophica crusticola]|uniref:histidine kinase n=1 Tax=Aerophototrophica crusticola TaxID=1709002 RepID=A0A858R855_9PROT|nr:response regulator [Rhodospirillaceae bacterium B3]
MTIFHPAPLKSEDRGFAATAGPTGPEAARLWRTLAVGGLGSLLLIGLDVGLAPDGPALAGLLAVRVLAVLVALGVARLALSRGLESAGLPLALWQGLLVAGHVLAFSLWSETLPGHLMAILLLMLVYLLAPNRPPVALALGSLLTVGHFAIYWLCPAPEPFPHAGVVLAVAALNLTGFMLLAARQGREPAPAATAPPAEPAPAVPATVEAPAVAGPDLRALAHDLRTPLNGLLGFAQLLAGTPLSAEQASHLEQIRVSAERLRRLLDERLSPAATKAPPKRPLSLATFPAPAATPARPLSVLVVEDDDVSRLLARTLLERDGHRVTEALDGQQAVEKAAAGGFDLVLMDIRLPVLSGTAAARRIRALPDPVRAAVPIIAVTGNASGADQAKHGDAGMDGTLQKPLERESLRAVLAGVAAKSPSPAPAAPGQPAAPAEPDPGVLDSSVLDGHREILGPVRVAHVVDSFLLTAPVTVAAVEAALAAGDLKTLGRAAHKLGSGALTVGLPALARLCRETEAKADGGEREIALERAAKIAPAYAAGTRALDQYKAKLGT